MTPLIIGVTGSIIIALLVFPGARLLARVETYLMVRSMESLAIAAKACHDLDEGRERERLLYALRDRLDAAGVPVSGHDEKPEEGPRGVFERDGRYTTPNGTVWDFSGSGGSTEAKAAKDDLVLEDGYRAAGNP